MPFYFLLSAELNWNAEEIKIKIKVIEIFSKVKKKTSKASFNSPKEPFLLC